MNNSSTTSTPNTEFFISMIQYVSFGSVAIITNLIIIFILLRNFAYFKKSAFISGLAVGDLLDGTSLLINGALRIFREVNGSSDLNVHPSHCMKIMVTPIFLMGNQIPGVMFFLVGVERFLAVYCYDWYYVKWSNKFAWMLTACAYIFCSFSVAAGFIVAFSYEETYRITIACGTSTVVGATYSAYNYSVAIIGGSVAAIATVIAMVSFTNRKNRLNAVSNVSTSFKSHVKSQWHLTRITLCLAVVDFGFLVVPSFLVFLSSGLNVNFNVNLSYLKAWSLQLVCFRSILNIIIYLFVNSEFRGAALRAFSHNKIAGQTIFTKNFHPPNPSAIQMSPF